ncbi:MAG: hypothetical protein AAB971_04165 [Patescibacteria group bacterium]
MSQHHVIYIPGIQDDAYRVQSLATWLWRLYGVRGHCHPMPWAGEEAYESKFQRLLERIDKYIAKGYRVSLVGASAGASAVLNAYVERSNDITGLVYICAKINAPETVSSKTYAANPAFKTALYALQPNLPKLSAADKAKMLSLYSPDDRTVPYEATVIPTVAEKRLPALRHGYAIMYSLTLGASSLIRFLKRQA